MKHLLTFLFLQISFTAFSQVLIATYDPHCGIYRNPMDLAPVVDYNPGVKPAYPGGDAAMQEFAKTEMMKHKESFASVSGREFRLAFVIDTSGKAANVYALNVAPADTNAAKIASSLICNMPNWTAGIFTRDRTNRKMTVKYTATVFMGTYKGKKMLTVPTIKLDPLSETQPPPPPPSTRPVQVPPQQPPANLNVQPQFNGGDSALAAYIKGQLKYPANAPKKSGTVIIGFIVSQDGRVEYPYVIQEIEGAPAYTEEAMRIVKSMPAWKAGSIKGVTSRMTAKVEIKF
jgi:hypothetical protein